MLGATERKRNWRHPEGAGRGKCVCVGGRDCYQLPESSGKGALLRRMPRPNPVPGASSYLCWRESGGQGLLLGRQASWSSLYGWLLPFAPGWLTIQQEELSRLRSCWPQKTSPSAKREDVQGSAKEASPVCSWWFFLLPLFLATVRPAQRTRRGEDTGSASFCVDSNKTF